jgi:hypothetical protein
VALVPASAAPAAPAAPGTTGDHCVVQVTGQEASGELTTSAPRCYASFAEGQRSFAGLADFELGRHCDGANLGAPCTSVVGSGCTGGWLNVSAAWNNRISSTLNGCPTINHFDLSGLSGSVEATGGIGTTDNLTTLDNRTTSIQYT